MGRFQDIVNLQNSGVYNVTLPVSLAGVTAADVITSLVVGHKFKLRNAQFVTDVVASTSGKAATLDFKIGSTPITGGSLALTTAGCDTKGKVTAGVAISALNAGSAVDTVSVVASAVTAFVQGSGYIVLTIEQVE
jgi:hypothetical protein